MIAERAIPSHRILYVGAAHTLPTLLQDALDCFVARSPGEPLARLFLESRINYSLLIFDEGTEGAESEHFARSLTHRGHTPVVIFKTSEDFCRLVHTIGQLLVGSSKV